jgi:hypothetical protein
MFERSVLVTIKPGRVIRGIEPYYIYDSIARAVKRNLTFTRTKDDRARYESSIYTSNNRRYKIGGAK